MAGGWTRDGAVLDQIEDTVMDGVLTPRARMPVGEGLADCEECGDPIPEPRRRALPSARTCMQCQSGRDGRIVLAGINRPGSKDSQLR
jgi:phage/conjugal plasmid C-4 type zinc finger TraR family protein